MSEPAGTCGTGRPAWLPEKGDLVEDLASRRTGRLLAYAQGPGCTPHLELQTPDLGTTWTCSLEDARAPDTGG